MECTEKIEANSRPGGSASSPAPNANAPTQPANGATFPLLPYYSVHNLQYEMYYLQSLACVRWMLIALRAPVPPPAGWVIFVFFILDTAS
jgi:hypothetical protein